MKFILTSIVLFSTVLSFSQIVFDKTEYDFGELNGNDPRYVDIYLKNKTGDDAFILSVKKPRDVVYIQKSAFIAADSTTVIRFHIDKRTTGRFSYTIPVFTSDKNDPTNVVLKGRIKSLPERENYLTACPSFGQAPATGNRMDFALTVETIDKATGEHLGKTKVAILQNGSVLGRWPTNSKGRMKIKIPLGISYFYGTHPGYFPAEKGMYVNFKRNHVVLALTKKPVEEFETVSEDLSQNEPKEAEPEKLEELPEEIQKELPDVSSAIEERVIEIDVDKPSNLDINDIIVKAEPVLEDATEEVEAVDALPPAFTALDKNNFDADYFKPINVVFVIDVSGSMRQEGRLELLKYALEQLVNMLRPEDKIGLVAYASDAFVLMESTTGDQKKEIINRVKKLKASGYTDGGAGIKLGYKNVRKNEIPGGQNHLIVVTDGAFNRNSGNYKKIIEKNLQKQNTTMSVVGIKSNKKAEDNMREAAILGEGRFILIENLMDAQSKLKEEIRLSSFKY